MRTLRAGLHRRDDGAVLIWVALMFVMLFGFGAIVIDVGALYQERRELQNGADAAALAVAKDCASGDCDNGSAAAGYANDNAEDGAANVDGGTPCGIGPTLLTCPDPLPDDIAEDVQGYDNWVFVQTSSSPDVDYVLAPVLDAMRQSGHVRATAVAAWGPLGSVATLPIAYPQCLFNYLGGSLDPLVPPPGEHTIYLHNPNGSAPPPPYVTSCPQPGGSGSVAPGAFSWLEVDEDCQAALTVGEWEPGREGDPNPEAVLDCDLSAWQNAVVALPLYDENRGTGGGEFHIAGFVGFRITGYGLNGNNRWPTNNPCGSPSRTCVIGEFTTIVVDGTIGDGTGFGASVVQMIG